MRCINCGERIYFHFGRRTWIHDINNLSHCWALGGNLNRAVPEIGGVLVWETIEI